jgi:hypothetical protein
MKSIVDQAEELRAKELRDRFAMDLAPESIMAIRVQADREALAGRPQPEDYPNGLDSIMFCFEVDAALRYMFADAMLKER